MKRLRLILAACLLSLAVAACSNVVGPRYPQPDEEKQDPPDTGMTVWS